MRERGIECQEEIVLPVLQRDKFAGYNRFDIVCIESKRGRREVFIIEVKSLSKITNLESVPGRVRVQCAGYRSCAESFFGRDTTVYVYLLNVSNDEYGISTVKGFNMKRLTKPESKPDTLFKIHKVLKKRTQRGIRQCLVWWDGFPKKEATWEPLVNIGEDC